MYYCEKRGTKNRIRKILHNKFILTYFEQIRVKLWSGIRIYTNEFKINVTEISILKKTYFLLVKLIPTDFIII